MLGLMISMSFAIPLPSVRIRALPHVAARFAREDEYAFIGIGGIYEDAAWLVALRAVDSEGWGIRHPCAHPVSLSPAMSIA